MPIDVTGAAADDAMMSLEQPLACACATSGLQVQVSAADFLLLHCPRCQFILAEVPVTNEHGPVAVKRISLAADETAQVLSAVSIDVAGPLAIALRCVLECSLPAAVRVAQQKLGQRPGLLKELRDALYSPDQEARQLVLQLIARMPQVPAELRHGALYAIQMTLREDPLSDALRVALMALYPLAGRGAQLRSEVERIVDDVAKLDHQAAVLTGRIAVAVLAAQDRIAAATQDRFITHRDKLIALLQQGQTEQAQAVLFAAFPENDPDDPDGGMTGRLALCEAAIDLLPKPSRRDAQRATSKPIVRTLLQWALDAAQTYAAWSSAGGEGLARMVAVNRLRERLKRLG